MWWIAVVAALVAAYLEIGWVGVAAGLVGLAIPYACVFVYVLRHGEIQR
jgi:hypothetical protein